MRERLDRLILARGLAPSRERARALIMEGKVVVDGSPALKAGQMIDPGSAVALKEPDIPYVSRGGLKLEAALKGFGIDLTGKTAMDVGASTGGFTDCMLAMGARKVYAVDVGYGQFDWKLRNDSRVVLLERTNIRHLEKSAIADEMDFAAVDVSFISLAKVMPNVREFMKDGSEAVALVKPQFEVGPKDVGKGGIVRDEVRRLEAVEDVKRQMQDLGFECRAVMESPIKGAKGNVEYLMHLIKRG